ncbi:hypothetical protein GCM10009602_32010 [Nocardiopsis tropica]
MGAPRLSVPRNLLHTTTVPVPAEFYLAGALTGVCSRCQASPPPPEETERDHGGAGADPGGVLRPGAPSAPPRLPGRRGTATVQAGVSDRRTPGSGVARS